MKEYKKKFKQKIKPYFIIITLFFISLLIFNNTQRETKYISKEKNNLFGKILEIRKLEEEESSSSKNYDNICKNSDEEFKIYYLTGNLDKIGEIDDYLIYDEKYKDEPYIESLINLINILIQDKSEKKNKLKFNSIKNDISNYLVHISPVLIFLGIGILLIPVWPICCCCCCCDCCCCCCCKKHDCKTPCCVFTFIFYLLTIIGCVYIIIKSFSIFEGIANTECSIHKFLEQILEGEIKQSNLKWVGFNNINEILNELSYQIEELRRINLNDLYQKIENITNMKIIFKKKMKESGKKFYSSYDSSTYSDLYSNEYSMDSRGISGTYVLDIIKMFGKKVINYENEEKYEPKNSTLDLWHNEYKLISTNADEYLDQALRDLQTISENKDDIIEKLEQSKENFNTLKEFFNDINKEINNMLYDYSEFNDKYFKKIFIIFFIILGGLSIIIIIYIICSCFFSQKNCEDNCCLRCFFKCSIHILWNILFLLMILIFYIGSTFILFGTFGNDIVKVIPILINQNNLEGNGESYINEQLGDAKNYLDIYINGNGSLIELLNIDDNLINSFYNIKLLEDQIYKTANEFSKRKSFDTYSYYVDQLNARLNLSVIPMLIKDDYELNIPLDDVQYYEAPPKKILKFDKELELMNSIIRYQETENERWIINSNSTNECNSGVDPIYYLSEFNPLKCKPLDRDWIQSTSNTDLKIEASIVSDILTFLYNANNYFDTDSLISILDDLKNEYNEYLDQYLLGLNKSKEILNKTNKNAFMNGKVIGTNLKIISKYFKTVFGKDIHILGICIIIIGFLLMLSIPSTILLLIIINIKPDINNAKINQNIKNSNASFPKTHLPRKSSSSTLGQNQSISSNISYTLNQKPKLKNPKTKPKPLSKSTIPKKTNSYFDDATEFLLEGCKIPKEILDETFNCKSGWRTGGKNGPSDYLKDYHPPEGWTAIGLKVALLYEDEDGAWLRNSHNPGEWYIGYHGVKSVEAIQGICKDGFKRGPRQAYANDNNINPLTSQIYPQCGEGVYFTNEINEAAKYTGPIYYNNKEYRVVFMCRINPHFVRIANIGDNKEYWIVEGEQSGSGDLFGKKKSEQVRPYRILIKKMNN